MTEPPQAKTRRPRPKMDPWEVAGLPKPGTTLLERYELERVIARGGMGVVYAAKDIELKRPVAVKVLPRPNVTERARARFLREARLAALISHPAIVRIFDAAFVDDLTILVMELLEGETIYQELKKRDFYAPREALRITAAVLDALSASHAEGVIHRDVKPSNILIMTEKRRVKLIDFGLSKDLKKRGPALTGKKEALGTPSYMSPEQVLADEVDARTDVYGMGSVLWEMLAGERAFPSDRKNVRKTFTAILKDLPPPPSTRREGISETVDAICMKALQKKAADRYESPRAMRDDCMRAIIALSK